MCCYNRPYDDQSQMKIALETQSKLQIQNMVKEGKLELVGSYILDYEASRNPFGNYFISTDIRLLKYKTSGIRLVTPCDFITEMEGER